MQKKVEKIVINLESIDVIAIADGVNSVTQLNLNTQENEISSIFEKYNLSDLTNYPFDINIVRALEGNKEQLIDYLQVCRRANYSREKVERPENFPEIEYDLRELKKSEMPTVQKLEIYKQAKATQNELKKARTNVEIKMSILDKGYFAIQELLQNRNKNQVQALSSGQIQRRSIREELYDKEYEEATNRVSRDFANKEEKEVETEKEVAR